MMSKRPARPLDAASLILVRREASGPAVLMGRRHPGHRFLPGRYVFPGGRVNRSDNSVRPASPLSPEVAERLARSCAPRRAEALALAALRETFEETGLVLGRASETGSGRAPARWREFLAGGLGPALDGLDYVCRAVTPTSEPIRFNTRFFLADAGLARGRLGGSGELLDLRWLGIGEAKALPIALITRYVLALVEELVANPPPMDGGRPVPLFRHLRGKPRLSYE